MDSSTEDRYLKAWGYSSKKALEDHVASKMQERIIQAIALSILGAFQSKVDEWKSEHSRDNPKRFFAEIQDPKDTLTKKPARIAEKILESKEKHEGWENAAGDKRGPEPTLYSPGNFMETMTDLIRFRIQCNYLADVEFIGKQLDAFIEDKSDHELITRDDYIATPFPERRVGHRALRYTVKYSEDGHFFANFEVQVMTLLQHSWDKKDHHLIYEYVRIGRGDEIPIHIRNRMAAMSELLYVADTVFDELRKEISKIMGNEP